MASLFFGFSRAEAADHYIRQGASGSSNGTDWTNAWIDLPATFIRGDTYYVADGTYGDHDFDTAASGSTYIYIKKATASEHGTETGWQSSYGDGQAEFSAVGTVFEFDTPYWDVDGVSGTGTSGHGLVVEMTGTSSGYGVRIDAELGNINLKHMEIFHSDPCGVGDVAQDGVRSTAADNVTISHCYIRDWARDCITATNSIGWKVEHSYLARSHSTASNHGQPIFMGYNASSDWEIKYNVFKDVNGSAAIFFSGACSNISIYGNLFWEEQESADCGNFSVSGITNHNGSAGDVTNMSFHNNTIVGFDGRSTAGYLIIDSGSGNTAYNNIFYGSNTDLSDVTHDYNASDDDFSEANDQIISSTIFTDYAGGDFSLSGATNAGTSLSSPYNQDCLTNPSSCTTRGTDGTWDRGAYEYVSGSTSARSDVDQSGSSNTTDAQLTLRYSLALDMSQTAWYNSATTGDADCSGTTNSTDAMLILRNSLGLDMSATAWCAG